MVKIIRHLANNCQFHPELFQIRMWKNLHLNWTSALRSDPTQPAASLTQDKDTILGEKVWLILANLRYSRALILTLWTKAILGSGWAVNTPRSSIGLGQVVRILISDQWTRLGVYNAGHQWLLTLIWFSVRQAGQAGLRPSSALCVTSLNLTGPSAVLPGTLPAKPH